MRSNRFWIALFGCIFAAALAASILLLRGKGGGVAVVARNGETLRVIDLSEVESPYAFTVDGPAGTNTVEVERGRVRVSCADCPDQVCVRQGWISDGVVPIVCLPNGLVIRIENGPEAGIDGVTG